MGIDADLHFLSAIEQGELIRRRQISPVDLARAYLERIDRYDGVLRAYISVCSEQALSAAKRAEREIQSKRESAAVILDVDTDQR